MEEQSLIEQLDTAMHSFTQSMATWGGTTEQNSDAEIAIAQASFLVAFGRAWKLLNRVPGYIHQGILFRAAEDGSGEHLILMKKLDQGEQQDGH